MALLLDYEDTQQVDEVTVLDALGVYVFSGTSFAGLNRPGGRSGQRGAP